MDTIPPPSPRSGPSHHPQREPPPSLFLGPPSRNVSNISLVSPPSTQDLKQRVSLLRSRSTRGPDSASTPLNRPRLQPLQPSDVEGDRTDALWAEMQATLAEVELSAFSSAHVFGSAHSAALEELREAQIALARSWGRSEAEGEDLGEETAASEKVMDDGKKELNAEDGSEDDGDLIEARRRRKANEKFFSRVSEGVVNVVGKLEGVAQAMAKVEKEVNTLSENSYGLQDNKALEQRNVEWDGEY